MKKKKLLKYAREKESFNKYLTLLNEEKRQKMIDNCNHRYKKNGKIAVTHTKGHNVTCEICERTFSTNKLYPVTEETKESVIENLAYFNFDRKILHQLSLDELSELSVNILVVRESSLLNKLRHLEIEDSLNKLKF